MFSRAGTTASEAELLKPLPGGSLAVETVVRAASD